MDVTKLFHEVIRAGMSDDCMVSECVPKRNFVHRSAFSTRALDVLSAIARMKNWLISHRSDYLCKDRVLYGFSSITESERDQIDCLVQEFIQNTNTTLEILLQRQGTSNNRQQIYDHETSVVKFLFQRLRTVCKIYTEMKATHIKRLCDRHRYSTFSPCSDVITGSVSGENSQNQFLPAVKQLRLFSTNVASGITPFTNWFYHPGGVGEVSLSTDQYAELERENRLLLDRLNSNDDPVSGIRSQVIDISGLQKVLMEHVLEQDQHAKVALGAGHCALTNVHSANHQLRRQIGAGSSTDRHIAQLIFFLALSLLFLHWYNL